MKEFTDADGLSWAASAREEQTPRHHTRWVLVFQSADRDTVLALPEIRWQTLDTAERTLASMSVFELRRRLMTARRRARASV